MMSVEDNRYKKLMIRQIVFIILTVLWMAAIFSFSAKSADESTEESNAVGMFVGRVVYSDFETWPDEEQQAFADKWDYYIRKAAHMTEYAVLGFLVLGSVKYKKRKYMVTASAAFGISFLYAVTDEIHQLFVPGRAGMIMDVGFDSLGAAAGVLFGTILFAWWDKD